MIRDFGEAFRGYLVWKRLKRKYGIDDRYAIIVLPESRRKWNQCAVKYLPDYMKRKRADKVLIVVSDKSEGYEAEEFAEAIVLLSEEDIRLLMKLYCLIRYSDKIVFFYLNYPRDNMSEMILEKGDISMDEVICLGLYQLREVPLHV